MMFIGQKIFHGRRLNYRVIGTSLDPFQDLISWVGYLISTEYTSKCLTSTHGFSSTDASAIANQVTFHAQMAQSLLKKSVDSSDETGFLDGYYGILNLMKICILFSTNHSRLPQNKLHGITYKPFDENTSNFPQDRVILKPTGTMSLFYQTLTGEQISNDLPVSISEIMPWLSGVTYEYELSSGLNSDYLQFNIQKDEISGTLRGCLNLVNPASRNAALVKTVPLLKNLAEHPSKPFWYVGRETTPEENLHKMARDLIVPEYCYRSSSGYFVTPMYNQSPKLVQEIPISLFFFAMSSIVRYYPTYTFGLKNSKWAPLLFASRRHSLLEFLILFWSYIQKEDYYINET